MTYEQETILDLLRSGMRPIDVADRLGVSKQRISKVRQRLIELGMLEGEPLRGGYPYPGPLTTVRARVPADTADKLRRAAARRGTSMAKVLAELIERELEEE